MQMKKSGKQFDSQWKINLQLIGFLIVTGCVVSYVILGRLAVSWIIVACSLLGAAWIFIVKVLGRSKMKSKESIAEKDNRVFSLNFEEAKVKALKLLNDKAKFDCQKINAGDPNPPFTQFGPHLREFFQEFESLKFVHGDAKLSRSDIRPSKYNPRYLKIGTDLGDAELAVLPGKETIIEWDGNDLDKKIYPTIYHWVLRLAEDIYPEYG
jgi:hypothetical protein